MIGSFRNFAKTKFAGILVFIMIIPFVFWGMGSMFSSGNTNTIAKINNTNISTQDFIDYLNTSNISQETIRKNLENNIIEELLSGLISRSLIELEVLDYNVTISEKTLLKRIKKNKKLHVEMSLKINQKSIENFVYIHFGSDFFGVSSIFEPILEAKIDEKTKKKRCQKQSDF